jgi:hypothetical protein
MAIRQGQQHRAENDEQSFSFHVRLPPIELLEDGKF